MTSVFRRTALLAGVMSLTAVAAFAAPAATPAPEARAEKRVVIVRSGDGPHAPGAPGAPHVMRWKKADPAARAEHLRTMLQLTPSQEPALQAYLEATKPQEMTWEKKVGGPDGEKGKEEVKRLTALERLSKQEEMMARHQAAFAKRAAAVRAFYAQLSPSQKKTFDAMPMMMHGGMGHGPMFIHGGHGGHGGHGEHRVRVIRGASGPEGRMEWHSEDGAGGAMMLGEMGDDVEVDIMIEAAPPPPPAL